MVVKPGLIKARDARRITAAEMKYMKITAGYTRTDYETNTQIAKELKITPVVDKLLGYKRNWIQHVNRMPRNRLPRVMKHYSPTGRRNHGRPLKRLLGTWDRNGSTSGPTPWHIYMIWWWWLDNSRGQPTRPGVKNEEFRFTIRKLIWPRSDGFPLKFQWTVGLRALRI